MSSGESKYHIKPISIPFPFACFYLSHWGVPLCVSLIFTFSFSFRMLTNHSCSRSTSDLRRNARPSTCKRTRKPRETSGSTTSRGLLSDVTSAIVLEASLSLSHYRSTSLSPLALDVPCDVSDSPRYCVYSQYEAPQRNINVVSNKTPSFLSVTCVRSSSLSLSSKLNC